MHPFGARPGELLGRQMANRFDVVTIRVKDERPIVVRMIMRAHSRWPVISSPGRERFGVERVHGFSISAGESDMDACLTLASEADPEKGFPVGSVARKGFTLGIEALNAERTQRLVIEFFRPLNIANANGYVIQHIDLPTCSAPATIASRAATSCCANAG